MIAAPLAKLNSTYSTVYSTTVCEHDTLEYRNLCANVLFKIKMLDYVKVYLMMYIVKYVNIVNVH